MSVLENFKNIPRSPYGGRQGSNVIFFQICNEVPGVKKKGGPVARWGGDRACRPLGGDRVPSPYKTWPTWPPYAAISFVI